jgi:hypothetical protein
MAIRVVPVDVRRNFDFTLAVDLFGQTCQVATGGISFGFIDTFEGIRPQSGAPLGLDASRRLWAASLTTDSSGVIINGNDRRTIKLSSSL